MIQPTVHANKQMSLDRAQLHDVQLDTSSRRRTTAESSERIRYPKLIDSESKRKSRRLACEWVYVSPRRYPRLQWSTYAIPPYPIAAPDSASLRCLKACITAVSLTQIANHGYTHPAVLRTFIGDETDHNKSDDGNTSKHTQSNRQHGQRGTRKLELRRAGGRSVRSGSRRRPRLVGSVRRSGRSGGTRRDALRCYN